MFCRLLSLVDKRLCAASVASLGFQLQKKEVDNDKYGSRAAPFSEAFEFAVKKCNRIVAQKMMELGTPGMVVGISVNGKEAWVQAFGYSDIENNVHCKPDTVMRIASVSKSLTMAAVARLVEERKLSLENSVHEYVPEFPAKFYNNEKAEITTRMLISHTSGIRHYQRKDAEKQIPEFENKEYYSMKEYKNVTEALKMFSDDDLVHKPGEKFLYTTHGWTLISAIIEKVSQEDFVLHMKKMFTRLGMENTSPEIATNLVYHRARQYARNEKGRLVNVPYVNNSYKWAGGGFISNVPDLLKFGNVMLYSFQFTGNGDPGFLKPETVKEMWSPIIVPEVDSDRIPKNETHGMGWFVYPSKKEYGCAKEYKFEVAHTGGAIGGSSILYILPFDRDDCSREDVTPTHDVLDRRPDVFRKNSIPQGIVVAILTNLQSVELTGLARSIAGEFGAIFQCQT